MKRIKNLYLRFVLRIFLSFDEKPSRLSTWIFIFVIVVLGVEIRGCVAHRESFFGNYF